MVFLALDRPFPNDGIRYQDTEAKYVVPVGNGRVSWCLIYGEPREQVGLI